MKVIVDVAGYNYSVRDFDEVVKDFDLNPIQVYLLKRGKQLVVKGDVTLESVPPVRDWEVISFDDEVL